MEILMQREHFVWNCIYSFIFHSVILDKSHLWNKRFVYFKKSRFWKYLKEKVNFHLYVKGKFQNKCNMYLKDICGITIVLKMRFWYFILKIIHLLSYFLSRWLYIIKIVENGKYHFARNSIWWLLNYIF